MKARKDESVRPVLYETHSQTPLCKHAKGEPEEYAQVALKRGLKGIVFTCHNPMPECWGTGVRMEHHEFDQYVELIARAKQAMRGQIEVRLGLECDFTPQDESMRFLDKQVESAPFEYILGSVHPHMGYYKKVYFSSASAIVDYQRQYFDHLVSAAESGLFDCLAHPDLVKNVAPKEWKIERIIDHIRVSLDRIARTGVAMELNTSGLKKPCKEMNPGMVILREMHERGIPVVIGGDAHEPDRAGADFERALDLVAEAGYAMTSFYLRRVRHEIPIAKARASLRPLAELAAEAL